VAEDGFIESAPKQDGRNMLMVLSPTSKKSEARVEVEAAKAARAADRAASAEEERRQEAELRAAAHAAAQPKKKRGPADNMDPDIDL
jgi:translation initiation factor IF-3